MATVQGPEKNSLLTIIDGLSKQNPQAPSTQQEIDQELKGSHNTLRKSALARAIQEAAINIERERLLAEAILQEIKKEEQLVEEIQAEIKKPENKQQLTPVMEAILGKIPNRLAELQETLSGNLNKLNSLYNQLNELKTTHPEAFQHLAQANKTAQSNAATVSKAIDKVIPGIDPKSKEIIVDRFNGLAKTATTTLMTEARYKRSLQKAGMADNRDVQLPENATKEQIDAAKEKKATVIATRNFMVQELSMRSYLAQIFEQTLGLPYSTANMRAGKALKESMSSEEVKLNIRLVMSSYNENEIDEAVEELARNEKEPENSFVGKLQVVQALLRTINSLESDNKEIKLELTDLTKTLLGFSAQMQYGSAIQSSRENLLSPFGMQPTPTQTLARGKVDNK